MDTPQFLLDTYQYFAANRIELLGTIFGLICVWLNTKEHIWAWPMGIVSVSLFIYIFWEAQLYGDFGLHIVYVVLGFYGWYNWLYGGASKTQLPVGRGENRELIILLGAVGLSGTLGMGYAFSAYTDNTFPYGDATTTVFSLIAQWQLTQKRLENWLVWIFVDIIASFIYYYKGLYITTGLYLIYLLLAAYGYRQWREIYRIQAQQANATSSNILQ